jgi:hypothetical protein
MPETEPTAQPAPHAPALGPKPTAAVARPLPKPSQPGRFANLPKSAQPRIRVLNGCGAQGVCKGAAEKLTQHKIKILAQDVTNAPNFKVTHSIVKTSRENLEWARCVAGLLGLDKHIQIIPGQQPYATVTVVIGQDYEQYLK